MLPANPARGKARAVPDGRIGGKGAAHAGLAGATMQGKVRDSVLNGMGSAVMVCDAMIWFG